MATPLLTRYRLPGRFGDILVDLRTGTGGPDRPAVVVLHGFKGFKDWGMFPSFMDRLARAGFAAVGLNTSGSGVDDHGDFSFPERFGRNTFSADLDDLATVIDALSAGAFGGSPSWIGLVGHSRGGGLAVLHAASDPRIAALVSWAPISHVHRWSPEVRRKWRETGWLDVTNQRTGQVIPIYPDILDDIDAHSSRLDIEAAAARIAVPWLIVHGAEDQTVPVGESRRLADLGPTAHLLILEHTGHTFGAIHPFAGAGPALQILLDRTVSFLTRAEGAGTVRESGRG